MISWENCFSGFRHGDNANNHDIVRTQFERDYDRIIFSSPFRRLQNKTQVFPLPGSVFVHNRLTHSLEVASVGRSLGKMAGELLSKENPQWSAETKRFYEYDLSLVVSAACLAHDIGNPPFGHNGESAISDYFTEHEETVLLGKKLKEYYTAAEWSDITHYEGNANGFRLLTHHFPSRLAGGYRLTYATLAAMAKYPCESIATDKTKGVHRKKFGFFQSEKERFREMAEQLNMIRESQQPLVYKRHPFVSLVEAADDICYLIIDWEDAHRLGILSFKEASKPLLQFLKASESDMDNIRKNLKGLKNDLNESMAYLRAKCIGALVAACANAFRAHAADILQGEFNQSLLDCIPENARQILENLRKTSTERIYRHESVVKIELAGYQIIHALLSEYLPALLQKEPKGRDRRLLQLLPGQYKKNPESSPYENTMALLDYISGMTDLYALERFRNLKGINLPIYS